MWNQKRRGRCNMDLCLCAGHTGRDQILFNIAYLFRLKTIKLFRQSFTFDIRTAGRIASLGFASGANNLTSTVVAFVSNNLMTKYGALSSYGADIPLTTFGLCMKVSMLAFSIGIGVASGSQPIIGFNYGAKKYDRVKKTFLLGAGVATIITFVSWIIFQCFPLQHLLICLRPYTVSPRCPA